MHDSDTHTTRRRSVHSASIFTDREREIRSLVVAVVVAVVVVVVVVVIVVVVIVTVRELRNEARA